MRYWLLGALLALLMFVAAGLAPAPTGAVPAYQAPTLLPPTLTVPTADCWITGDVVGDANPSTIRTNLCQQGSG
jgi:hypothetical protein